MKTSIDRLLQQQGFSVDETEYALNVPGINEFVITAGSFFRLEPCGCWQEDLWLTGVHRGIWDSRRENPVCHALQEEIEKLSRRIRDIKEADPKGYGHMEELRVLRSARKSAREALGRLLDFYWEEAGEELRRAYGARDRAVLCYKNTVCLGSFRDLERQAPVLTGVDLPWIRQMPLLLANTAGIRRALENDLPIGLVGGPCLFGSYEVEILVEHRDGSRYAYDFSSGRHYDRKGRTEPDFAGHVERHANEIACISFRDHKKGITAQERESLEILFAFAVPLHARVAVPVPDISYLKYLAAVTAPLPESLRAKALEEFRGITRRIADLYLAEIGRLMRRFPQVEVKVLHERDRELCRVFYEKRETFFSRSGLIRRMTARRGREEAVFDYISMLALPFYFWGTPQVIQLDNLDETDSYRKCRKVHKGAFSLSAILYPERLIANGEDTIFNAPPEEKMYIEETVECGEAMR